MDDTTVLCTVKYIPDSKSFNTMSLRWVPVTKLQRKLSVNVLPSHDVYTTNSKLLSTTQAMMTYNHVSKIPLSRGLYVAYVKISSSVDLIRILVPKKAPNILPYYKVRDNPHVSSEEWLWLKSKTSNNMKDLTPRQLKFKKVLSSALRNLLKILDVPSDQVEDHRLFDNEVIELNSDVSLLLLLPPVNSVCAAPGQKDCITERKDCVLLPLQIFEIIHMSTYQPKFISRYSRVSSLLEINTTNAQQVLREAFSKSEVAIAKSKLRQLQHFQTQIDKTWRSMRWLMDVLNFARDRNSSGGISLSHFMNDKPDSPSTESPIHSPKHFQSTHSLQGQVNFPQTDIPYSTHFNYDVNPVSCPSFATCNSIESAKLNASKILRCTSISDLPVISELNQTFPFNASQLFQPSTNQSRSQKNLTLPRNYKIDSTSNQTISTKNVTNDLTYFPSANVSNDLGDMSQFTISDVRRRSSISESMINGDSNTTILLNSAQSLHSSISQSIYQKNLTLPRNYKIDSTPNKTVLANNDSNRLYDSSLSNVSKDTGDLSIITPSDAYKWSSITELMVDYDSNKSDILDSAQLVQSSSNQFKDQKNLTLPRNYKSKSLSEKHSPLHNIITDLSCSQSTNVSSSSSDLNQLSTIEVHNSATMPEMMSKSSTMSRWFQPTANQFNFHETLTLPRNYKMNLLSNKNTPTNHDNITESSASLDSIQGIESKTHRCSSVSGLILSDNTHNETHSKSFQSEQFSVRKPACHFAASTMQRCTSVSASSMFSGDTHQTILSRPIKSTEIFGNKPVSYKIATLPRNYKIDSIPELL